MTGRCFRVFAALLAAAALSGCAEQKCDMADMMKAPPRPAELDQLDMMVGKWESTAECKMAGSDKPMTCKSSSVAGWECDRRALVERMEGTMGDQKMSGIGVWMWNPESRNFSTWWFDSTGRNDKGTATFDAATKTWTMKSATGQGTARMAASDTMDWSFKETTGGLFPQPVMEMKGTSKRK